MSTFVKERRSFLRHLGVATLAVTGLALGGRASAAPASDNRRGLTVSDLARERSATLPKGGTYDHITQKRQGREIDLAQSTNTGGGEDNCCGSTTFWDGEQS